MGNPTGELRAKLSEHGIEYEVVDRGIEQNTFWNLNGVRYKYNALVDSQHGCLSICCANFLTPEQAIAATVGDKPKDNPRNYNPDGTPKIPNMHIGADPDWVDWVARLKHEEPLSLKEAVEQFMFEIICFGGDMGPNDCGGEHCPDEGMVYTNDFIDGWVNKIAATAGKDIERYDGSGRRGTVAILQGGRKPEEVLFVRYEGGVTHYLPEDADTCHMEVKDNLAETEGMGEVWLECDKCHWQMPLEPTTPRFKYCPNCRAEIREDK